MFCLLLAAVGAYSIVVWTCQSFRSTVLLLWCSLKQWLTGGTLAERYGPWAVVTGASDGIGRGYALHLARMGLNVVLISRTEAKLHKVEQEIKLQYGVATKCIAVDFAKGDQVYEHLEKALAKLEIGILVNNVGTAYETPVYVDEMPKKALWSIMTINVGAATAMCHMLLPGMKQRHRGLVINISSMASLCPTPYMTVYAATKSYMTSFSEALLEELRPFNVEVQTVSPGYVHTNLTDTLLAKADDPFSSLFMISLEKFMKFAGFTIGKTDTTTGHWIHGLQTVGWSVLPVYVRTIFMKLFYQNLQKKLASKGLLRIDNKVH